MKYYEEELMKPFRLAFEETVFPLPQITTKQMFGCPSYKANGKLFTFLVTNGLVIVKLSQTDREELSRQFQTTPFQSGKNAIEKWPQIPLKTVTDLEQIMPFVQESYEFTLQET